MEGRYAVLMGNHGLLAAGTDIAQAYITAEEIEFGCEVYWRARCVGTPVPLTDDQLKEQLSALAKYYRR